MRDSIISRLLNYFIKNWTTKNGFTIGSLLILLILPPLLVSLTTLIQSIFVSLLALLFWLTVWVYFSGRIILPTKKETVLLCFNVDWDGIKNYKRVINKIISSLDEVGLNNKIRLKIISYDIIANKEDAHKFRENKNVDLIIWGKTDYGYKNNEKVLLFEVYHTIRLSKNLSEKLSLFLSDLTLIFAKRNWEIKEINELEEYKVVSDNFLQTILFIIGIHFYETECLLESIKIFEQLLLKAQQKQGNDNFIEYRLQYGRIHTLLIEQYFLYGRILHDNGKISESLKYLKKIPAHVPNPVPLYIMLARVTYLDGDEISAYHFTEKLRKLNKRHPAVCLNYAFFGIKEKNYDRVKFWYDELLKQRVIIDVDLMPAITFLDDEFKKSPTEFSFLYALGIVNGCIDLKKRKRDLQRFIKLTKNRPEYYVLNRRAKELIKWK